MLVVTNWSSLHIRSLGVSSGSRKVNQPVKIREERWKVDLDYVETEAAFQIYSTRNQWTARVRLVFSPLPNIPLLLDFAQNECRWSQENHLNWNQIPDIESDRLTSIWKSKMYLSIQHSKATKCGLTQEYNNFYPVESASCIFDKANQLFSLFLAQFGLSAGTDPIEIAVKTLHFQTWLLPVAKHQKSMASGHSGYLDWYIEEAGVEDQAILAKDEFQCENSYHSLRFHQLFPSFSQSSVFRGTPCYHSG